MAFFSDTSVAAVRPTFMSAVLAKLADILDRLIMAHDRTDAVEKLQTLSDRELAEIGLTRDDIVRHVYRDIYYL